MAENVRLNVTIPAQVAVKLAQLAEQYGVSKSAIIAIAITEKFTKDKGGKDA